MQLLRFLLVGTMNSAVGLSCIYLAMGVLGLNYIASNAAGYAIGGVLGFILNRKWTFQHEGSWRGALWKWTTVIGLSFGLNLFVVTLLHTRLGTNPYLAQLGGVICYSVAGYLGARYFVFPHKAEGTP